MTNLAMTRFDPSINGFSTKYKLKTPPNQSEIDETLSNLIALLIVQVI
jgi:hypothetical protein